jgi:uncharacterized protein
MFLLTEDQVKISCTHYQNGRRQVIVVAHGFFNSKNSTLLQQLGKELFREYDVFLFDFRGHGQSSGLFTWSSWEDRDLKAVLRYLEGKYERIGLIGFSLGGSIGLNVLAQTRNVSSFVCVAAPAVIGKIDFHWWALDWENDISYALLSRSGRRGKGVRPGPFWLKKTIPVDVVRQLDIPILYIHGDKDWIVRPYHSQLLFEQTISKKKNELIKGGSHAEFLLRKHGNQMLSLIRDWFQETLS